MLALSTLDTSTSAALAAVEMLVLGLGLGMVMQVLVLAVQNAVPYEQLGVATSGATLFRSIGGSVGTAVLGAIFTTRLTDVLAAEAPPGAAGALEARGVDPSALQQLPAPVRDAYVSAFTDALDLIFVVAACVLAVAFVLAWLLPERPLRATVAAHAGLDEAFATPRHADSVREAARGLDSLIGREGAVVFLRRAIERAGLHVTPLESWVLVRAASDGHVDVPGVAATSDIDPGRLRDACRALQGRGLLGSQGDGATGLTEDGHRAVVALAAAQHGALCDLASDWEPDRHPDLAAFVDRLSRDLVESAARA
jgi:hypothetical protein